MRSKKWGKKKEFVTETLTQVEAENIVEDSEDYANGRSPFSRNTQYAEGLEDMVALQKKIGKGLRNSITTDTMGHRSLKDTLGNGGDAEDFEPRPLTPEDAEYHDIMEQFTSTPTKPKYWYEESGDYWSCSCGTMNKGEKCNNCGLEREILRSLFFLHRPGDEPGSYEGMPVKYEEVYIPKGKLTSKQKMIISIIALLVIMVTVGIFSYLYLLQPAMEREKEKTSENVSEHLLSFLVQFDTTSDTFLFDSYVVSGDASLKDKKYDNALMFYTMAKKINDTDKINDKIAAAKFAYVSANLHKGGNKFETYLAELKDAAYPGINEIYYAYYKWKFDIVCNLSPDNYSDDISSASRSDTVYFHVTAGGGPPGETIDVYYEATWPNGGKEINMLGTGWKAGSREYARFSYPVPIMGQEGKFVFKIYNRTTKELLGTDSVKFKK